MRPAVRIAMVVLAAFTVAACGAHDEKPETVLLLHLDEGQGTVAGDASGSGADGRVMGDCTWGEGKFGGGMEMHGDGHVLVGRPAALDFGKTCDFTVECWIKVAEGIDPQFYFILSTRLRIEDGYTLYLHPNFRLFAAVGDKVNWTDSLASEAALNDGQWHHVGLTCDRDGEARLFVDGALQSSADMSFLVTVRNETLPLRIGSRGYRYDFIGSIDEVRISRGVREDFLLEAPGVAEVR